MGNRIAYGAIVRVRRRIIRAPLTATAALFLVTRVATAQDTTVTAPQPATNEQATPQPVVDSPPPVTATLTPRTTDAPKEAPSSSAPTGTPEKNTPQATNAMCSCPCKAEQRDTAPIDPFQRKPGYGWQIALGDLANVTVHVIAGLANDNQWFKGSMPYTFVGTYAVLSPVIHLAHGRPGRVDKASVYALPHRYCSVSWGSLQRLTQHIGRTVTAQVCSSVACLE